MELQCETRRYYSVETNGNAHGTCTPTSGHVSPRKTDQWKLRYCRKDQPGARVQEKMWMVSARHAPRRPEIIQMEFTKRASCFRLSMDLNWGERPRSHTLYIKPFYVARFVPALYLPDNLTPIYGFVRVKSLAGPKNTTSNNRDIETW